MATGLRRDGGGSGIDHRRALGSSPPKGTAVAAVVKIFGGFVFDVYRIDMHVELSLAS